MIKISFTGKTKKEAEGQIKNYFPPPVKNQINYSDPNYLINLCNTDCYQNSPNRGKPKIAHYYRDFNSICLELAEEIKTGKFHTNDAVFNSSIIRESKNIEIGPEACKLIIFILQYNNLLSVQGKKTLSIIDTLKQVYYSFGTLNKSTVAVNLEQFYQCFIPDFNQSKNYIELKLPGSHIVDFARDHAGKLIHLRCYNNIDKRTGNHSIACRSHDEDSVVVFDSNYKRVNGRVYRKQDLEDNVINSKQIAYAGVVL